MNEKEYQELLAVYLSGLSNILPGVTNNAVKSGGFCKVKVNGIDTIITATALTDLPLGKVGALYDREKERWYALSMEVGDSWEKKKRSVRRKKRKKVTEDEVRKTKDKYEGDVAILYYTLEQTPGVNLLTCTRYCRQGSEIVQGVSCPFDTPEEAFDDYFADGQARVIYCRVGFDDDDPANDPEDNTIFRGYKWTDYDSCWNRGSSCPDTYVPFGGATMFGSPFNWERVGGRPFGFNIKQFGVPIEFPGYFNYGWDRSGTSKLTDQGWYVFRVNGDWANWDNPNAHPYWSYVKSLYGKDPNNTKPEEYQYAWKYIQKDEFPPLPSTFNWILYDYLDDFGNPYDVPREYPYQISNKGFSLYHYPSLPCMMLDETGPPPGEPGHEDNEFYQLRKYYLGGFKINNQPYNELLLELGAADVCQTHVTNTKDAIYVYFKIGYSRSYEDIDRSDLYPAPGSKNIDDAYKFAYACKLKVFRIDKKTGTKQQWNFNHTLSPQDPTPDTVFTTLAELLKKDWQFGWSASLRYIQDTLDFQDIGTDALLQNPAIKDRESKNACVKDFIWIEGNSENNWTDADNVKRFREINLISKIEPDEENTDEFILEPAISTRFRLDQWAYSVIADPNAPTNSTPKKLDFAKEIFNKALQCRVQINQYLNIEGEDQYTPPVCDIRCQEFRDLVVEKLNPSAISGNTLKDKVFCNASAYVGVSKSTKASLLATCTSGQKIYEGLWLETYMTYTPPNPVATGSVTIERGTFTWAEYEQFSNRVLFKDCKGEVTHTLYAQFNGSLYEAPDPNYPSYTPASVVVGECDNK